MITAKKHLNTGEWNEHSGLTPQKKKEKYFKGKVIPLCTFCGEGRGALLDSVELQQQAVQLRQVAAQGGVHGNS